MTTIFGGFWLADSVGSFFQGGGAAYYDSPIQPQPIWSTCLGWSSWSNFVSNDNYDINGYTSTYFASHMLNSEWVLHHSGTHEVFPSFTDIKDPQGNSLVTSYALHRPDGIWSVMLLNCDETHEHRVRVVFEDAANRHSVSFTGKVSAVTFGNEQYVWIDNGPMSHADPDHAPVGTTLKAGGDTVFVLPKASVTVLRGKFSNP